MSRGRPARDTPGRARGRRREDPAHRTRTYRAIRTTRHGPAGIAGRNRREGDVAEGARAAAAPPTDDDDDDDGTARAPDGGEACDEWTGQSSGAPRCYFLVHNIAKKHNVGTIARCATAFGVRSVVLIGAKSYNTFGCKGSSNHVDFVHYPTLADAGVGLMERLGVTKILGVEICDGAVPIETHPFDAKRRSSPATRATG